MMRLCQNKKCIFEYRKHSSIELHINLKHDGYMLSKLSCWLTWPNPQKRKVIILFPYNQVLVSIVDAFQYCGLIMDTCISYDLVPPWMPGIFGCGLRIINFPYMLWANLVFADSKTKYQILFLSTPGLNRLLIPVTKEAIKRDTYKSLTIGIKLIHIVNFTSFPSLLHSWHD